MPSQSFGHAYSSSTPLTLYMPSVRSLFSIMALLPSLAAAQSRRTQIVMLGTGTPIPEPDRSGPAVAIVIDSVAYLFDAGTGVVRRAAAAGRTGVTAFAPRTPTAQPSPRFERLFLTHLHSDHTLGVADVILTPWIQGRVAPLHIYGPPGTRRLVSGILDGNAEDIAERVASSGLYDHGVRAGQTCISSRDISA